MKSELLYQIGLTLLHGIGDVNAKGLLAYCGSPEQVFRHKKQQLLKIPGIGEGLARSIASGSKVLKRAEQELAFIDKYKIKPLFYTDTEYPSRLRYCLDGPILLYYKGTADLNAERVVSVVGTRRPSAYGAEKTAEIITGLQDSGILLISGLAYGIDAYAHKAALDNGLQTVGVLAHGLDRIYPPAHDKVARQMLKQGGLLTDYMSDTTPDAPNFPKRNRIVAGMCDALIVIESKRTGGSLITATIAASYNRDVFALPGRAGDPLAEGCNGLIKRNKASLIENSDDLLDAMQWLVNPKKKKSGGRQIPLLVALTEEEQALMNLLEQRKSVHVDEICQILQLPVSKVSTLLLQLEFSNLVRSRPGKCYELV